MFTGNQAIISATTQAAGEQDAQNAVEGAGARQTLNGFHPCWDGEVVVGLGREEVREDGEDDGGVEELQDADGEVGEAEDHAAEAHGEGWLGLG